MSYQLDIRPDAMADIVAAVGWYEQQQPGLGADFARTVRRAVNDLPANPLIHRIRYRRQHMRWFLPPRFPYRIIYRVQDELITVVAVLHSARHDRHSKKRV